MASEAGDAAQELINSYNEKISKVAPGAVGIQLGLMAAVGLACLCAFSILRPNNSVVYQPKLKYATDEKRPPKIGKGLFDWVAPVLQVSEAEMMKLIGLDAVAYLRFVRMCRNREPALLVQRIPAARADPPDLRSCSLPHRRRSLLRGPHADQRHLQHPQRR